MPSNLKNIIKKCFIKMAINAFVQTEWFSPRSGHP